MDERERSCVGSGHCCKTAPCPFGVRLESGACAFLVPWPEVSVETIRYRCDRYDEIVGLPGSEHVPAFGQGCSSPLFNVERQAIVRELSRSKR